MARKEPRARVEVPPGGWQGRSKSPRATEGAAPTKAARALHIDAAAVKDRRPVWRFGDHDRDGEYSPGGVTPDHLRDLLDRLGQFESMTVGEIFSPSGPGKHYEVPKMPRADIRRRLVELERDDEDLVHVLRCGGTERLYGFLREHVFHVLWWDPNHEIWPSKKKNT